MPLCSEHYQYNSGFLDFVTRILLSVFDSSPGSSKGNSFMVGQDPAVSQKMIEGVDVDIGESVDNVFTVAFLMFLTVLIVFLGAGLVGLTLVMLMHSDSRQADDEEKQVGGSGHDSSGDGIRVVDQDEKL